MNNNYPKEVGLPRKLIFNKEEWLSFVNSYNGKKQAVYQSVYSFEQTTDNNKANYESAIVDKVFLDFDDRECDGNAWNEVNKVHQYCLTNNLKHILVMSGRGYHIYILLIPYTPLHKKSMLQNIHIELINNLKLITDKHIVGNLAQMARVPNTFHPIANRFCISINKEQFEKGDEFIKKLASKQNMIKDYVIGEKLMEIKDYDCITENGLEVEKISDNLSVDVENIIKENDFPDFIQHLLETRCPRFRKRYLLILYLKEIGFTRKEVYDILKLTLSPNKFNHCINEERQLQYIFNRDDLLFPSNELLIKEGFNNGCLFNCKNLVYKE